MSRARREAFSAIVLAGGESRRFGSPKALAPLDGLAVIDRIVAHLEPVFSEILIVTKTPELFCPQKAVVVRDALPHQSPLVGLYSGLRASSSEKNFVYACDMPFPDAVLIRRICRWAGKTDAVIPRVNGRLQPLCAVYTKRCLGAIRSLLRNGERSLTALIPAVRARIVAMSDGEGPDALQRNFFDIDTPSDWRRAKAWM